MSKMEELLQLIESDDFSPEIHAVQEEALQRFDEEDVYRT